MAEDQPTITDEQDRLLASFLARGWSQKAAAESVGISERTVNRRMQDRGFRAEVDRLSSEIINQACRKLGDLTTQALDRLGDLLKSKNENVSLKAARCLVSLLIPLNTSVELRQRMEALEQKLGIRR